MNEQMTEIAVPEANGAVGEADAETSLPVGSGKEVPKDLETNADRGQTAKPLESSENRRGQGAELSSGASADPDPCLEATLPQNAKDELDRLRNELNSLREEIAGRRALGERIEREYGEFRELFPDLSIAEIPDGVWEDVRAGVPLSAAFAVAERRRTIAAALAEAKNAENAARSSGAVAGGKPEGFSCEEVRAMSGEEVRANLPGIMEAMTRWGN